MSAQVVSDRETQRLEGAWLGLSRWVRVGGLWLRLRHQRQERRRSCIDENGPAAGTCSQGGLAAPSVVPGCANLTGPGAPVWVVGIVTISAFCLRRFSF